MTVVGATAYLSLLLVSVVVSGVLVGIADRYRHRRGALTFGALVGCLFVWSLGEAVGFATNSLELARTARRVTYVVVPFVPVTVLALGFQYTGREQYVSPTVLGALMALPTMSAALALTNPTHGLFWSGGELVAVSDYSVYLVERELWFWVHAFYSYVLLAGATYLFVHWGLTAGEEYRRQARFLLAGILVPWLGNAASLSGVASQLYDPTPVFFTVAGVCIGVAVFRFRFLDLVPVARDTVVEVMRDGVLVLDAQNRVVDANPAVQRLLDVDEDELVGQTVDAVAPPPLTEVCREAGTGTTITLSTPRGERTFDVRRSALPGGARMVLLYDVTERRRQAEQLEHQNERLEKFGSMLSHDLRNPLNVAQGYVDLLADEAEGEEAEHARRASEALDRMEALISNTLTLAQEGAAVTDPEPVTLVDVAADAWRNVDTDAASLEEPPSMTVSADEERLQRLFENLFRNSVEHGTATRADGGREDTVQIWIESLDDGFVVCDDGPGIPEGKREEALEWGFTTSDDGTGLGLAIVGEIAEAHGWNVDITESEPGGACVEFHGVEPANGRETP